MATKSESPRGATRRAVSLPVVAILPLYNGELWIEGSMRSVLAQTVLPTEFIVIDDGSTDGGVEIVRQIAKEHPFIRVVSQLNAGQSAARNFAISIAKSPWVALIDQDDIWYPNHIEDLLNAVDKHHGLRLGWAYSDFDDIDIDGHLVARHFIRRTGTENPKRDLRTILSQGFIVQPSATLINRAAILDVGGFDERLSGYEDDDLFLRIFMANYDNVFIKESTSQWRIHETSAGASARAEESLRIYTKKLLDAFPNDRWRGNYYRSDLIAPRMIRIWLHMYMRASRYKDRRKMKAYVHEARLLLRYLRPRMRLNLSMITLLMSQPLFIRMSTASVESRSILWTPFIGIGRRLVRV
jgi:glycosyltransferase involved in cell wall biosynthesis